jgi:chromatin structure-remodeling complex subunit SFH1
LELEEERMGRGERSKKKRRFRSLSPLARSGTPGGRGTPDVGGYGGGGGGALTDVERLHWRCAHCRVWGTSVWAVRDGPAGPRVSHFFHHTICLAIPQLLTVLFQTLCASCGYSWERDRKLSRQTKNLHG